LRDDRSVKTADDNPVAFVQDTVRKYDINGRTQSLDNLDFEHCALELRQIHQAVAHTLLREIHKQHDHIRHTFSCDGGRRDDGDIACEALVLVVEYGIQTLLGEGHNSLL
jgi:hypothetical protein